MVAVPANDAAVVQAAAVNADTVTAHVSLVLVPCKRYFLPCFTHVTAVIVAGSALLPNTIRAEQHLILHLNTEPRTEP